MPFMLISIKIEKFLTGAAILPAGQVSSRVSGAQTFCFVRRYDTL
jgi:hypothetical protein